ncbi:diacylglycerol kinase-like protein [Trypanosoma theileri]|uniref:Diacylglycerol kinase n=1 Tax=Trypanosoma theileri TaxID=67003 RepID=A0A1X0NZZ0_9TRYP|nr:diacylglycerol kinase-like protein [Trypanosoma theileri]ORC90264.1 diacylglycerol kinase-like protein [Trypanosoma theileri]
MLVDDHFIPEEKSTNGVTVALINTNSGERAAADFVHKQLIANLGKENVFDLFPTGGPAIEEAKEFLTQQKPAIVIVAGGDGTVSLALDIMDDLRKENKIPNDSGFAAVIPMGTGNDLSRTLGFGGGYVKPITQPEEKFKKRLSLIQASKKVKMDRWSVVIQKTASPLTRDEKMVNEEQQNNYSTNEENPVQRYAMLNYFSIGFDAAIVSQFSTFRDDHPELCQQRSVNKIWYGCFGCTTMCTSDPLPKHRMHLQVDGVSVPIPSGAKALVVANVTTYAGGAVLWKDERARFARPSVADGMVEISVLYGVWHAAGVHTGVRNARKIAQGHDVHIIAPASHALQCDGEPIKRVGASTESVEVRITQLSTTLVMQCEEKEEDHLREL